MTVVLFTICSTVTYSHWCYAGPGTYLVAMGTICILWLYLIIQCQSIPPTISETFINNWKIMGMLVIVVGTESYITLHDMKFFWWSHIIDFVGVAAIFMFDTSSRKEKVKGQFCDLKNLVHMISLLVYGFFKIMFFKKELHPFDFPVIYLFVMFFLHNSSINNSHNKKLKKLYLDKRKTEDEHITDLYKSHWYDNLVCITTEGVVLLWLVLMKHDDANK